MKRISLLLIALLNASALLSASTPLSNLESTHKATGFPTSMISVTQWSSLLHATRTEKILPGTSQKRVQSLLGQPAKTLAPDVLLYDNCAPDQKQAQHCRDLIITIKNGKVASMVFSNPLMTEIIAFQAQYKKPDTPPAALALPTN